MAMPSSTAMVFEFAQRRRRHCSISRATIWPRSLKKVDVAGDGLDEGTR